MIINIRGTSGSGKSTLMREFIDRFGMEEAGGTPTIDAYFDSNEDRRYIKSYGYWTTVPIAHIKKSKVQKKNGLAVVGDYETDCGGCDGITTKGAAQDEIQDRVRYLAKGNHVLFEGLLISHIYGRYREMALNEYPGQFLIGALDTPLELCKERINQRRASKGRNELEDHRNTEMMFDDVLEVEQKCWKDGVPFTWIDHTRPFKHVCELLGLKIPPKLQGS